MPTIRDLIRDSPIASGASGVRYGAEDPYTLALSSADRLGYPQPGASNDQGEAQRYEASRLASHQLGAWAPLLMNPFHEGVLSWFAEGEGRPRVSRLMAGYRGALDAMEAPEEKPVVREGYGLQGAQIKPDDEARRLTIGNLLASILSDK